jgi:aminoglycoside phosphotransferase (APT) family kinase protein
MALESPPTAVQATDPAERRIADWIGANLGAQVTRIDRQGRWRPAWFVDAVRDGKPLPLYVRGERTESFLPYSLAREYEIQRRLEQGGVRTAHVHGYIGELPGIVMDRVAGRSNLGTADSEADRQAVRAQLVEQMALMHGLDTAPFREGGLRAPDTPRGITLSFFDDAYANYRSRKQRPDPGLEFVSAWVLRNAPDSANPLSYTACDAGQFLFEGPRLTAMMDFELSVLGDPLMDLAALRIRDQWEKLGDLPSFYALYAERTGRAIDLQTIRFHTVAFSLGGAASSAICMDQFLSQPQADADYVEYSIWVIWELKQALEALAEHAGVVLAPFQPPKPRRSWLDEPLFALRSSVDAQSTADDVEAYRKRARQSVTTYLQRVAAYGAQLEADYVRDAADLLGRTPTNGEDADALLDAHVQQAGPEEDERLLRLLHTNVCRRAFLLAAPDSPYLSGLVEPLIPIR